METWNYDKQPGFSDELLKQRSKEALRVISNRSPRELTFLIQDTRRLHRAYFEGLTPPYSPYWVGNYRGANFPWLRTYEVSFAPALNGCPARHVDVQMSTFAAQASLGISRFDLLWADSSLSPQLKLYRLAELAALLFVAFLDIHPYADGNGHMSRYIVIALFAIYGFRLNKMPIHPRPSPTPPLHQLLGSYRAGHRAPLVNYLVSALAV